MTISGTGAMWDYGYTTDELGQDVYTEAPWKIYLEELRQLVLNSGITHIGNNAFNWCSGFTGSLTIPDSVTEIGNNAFNKCSGFTGSLTIPDGVTEIGYHAFEGCSGFIGSLTIPDGVREIGFNAFEGCSGFRGSLKIPDGVTRLYDHVFKDCSGFTESLIIPKSVYQIDGQTFYNCTGLTDVYISEKTYYIGNYTFHKGTDSDIENSTPLSVTMHCPAGSYAYGWAVEHGFQVDTGEPKPDEPEPDEPEPDEPVVIKPVPVTGDKAVIQVYSMSTKEPIKDAEVTIGAYTYNTDSNGEVSVSASDSWNKITVKVDADDYLSALRGVKVKKGQVSRIGLTKKEDGIQITSVMAYQDNDIYDLLGEKLVLGYRKDLMTFWKISRSRQYRSMWRQAIPYENVS